MSAAIMGPADNVVDRLTDLCVEAKHVLDEAGRADLGTIDQLIDLLLFELGIRLARCSDHDGLDGDGGDGEE